MRNWIFVAVIGLATCGQAWAWDDDYPIGGTRQMDEMEAEFGPPSPPVLADKDDDGMLIDHYRRQQRNYEEAVGRLTVDNARKTDKILKQQQRILEGKTEKGIAETLGF